MPAGPDFRYTNFSGGRGFRILRTQNYRVAVTVAFYLHKLFGLPSPSHLHFTYTNFSGGRGFAFYLHTLLGLPSPSQSSYTHFSGCRQRRILPTETFSGCRHRRSCILGTQTFRVAGVLHFTYPHFSGVRSVALYLHTKIY